MIIRNNRVKVDRFPEFKLDETTSFEVRNEVIASAESVIGVKFSNLDYTLLEVLATDIGYKFLVVLPSSRNLSNSDRIHTESCYEVSEVDFHPSEIQSSIN